MTDGSVERDIREASEQGLLKHNHASWLNGATSPHCPTCRLLANLREPAP